MQGVELLKLESAEAYRELRESIADLTQEQAWARIDLAPGEYLHSEGSILSVVAHVAGCKFIYGSAGFRDLEVRWRDIVADLEALWPDWDQAVAYLERAHEYWMASWAEVDELEQLVQRFDWQRWSAWKIIGTVLRHDSYHAGQIQVLRSALKPSKQPPPPEGDLWRKYCKDLPTW